LRRNNDTSIQKRRWYITSCPIYGQKYRRAEELKQLLENNNKLTSFSIEYEEAAVNNYGEGWYLIHMESGEFYDKTIINEGDFFFKAVDCDNTFFYDVYADSYFLTRNKLIEKDDLLLEHCFHIDYWESTLKKGVYVNLKELYKVELLRIIPDIFTEELFVYGKLEENYFVVPIRKFYPNFENVLKQLEEK
jgi:hypothetical protein